MAVRKKVDGSGGGSGYTNYAKLQSFESAKPQAVSTATNYLNRAIQAGGYDQSWVRPALELMARESGLDPNAKNPTSTARGYFQFLDGTRKNYGGSSVNWDDPYQQVVAGLKYIKDRYGTPEKALAFWDKNKWY